MLNWEKGRWASS